MKHIAWGNGEPCPFCGKLFKTASVEHLMKEHEAELLKALFPSEANS